MNIHIVENEKPAADKLVWLLMKIDKSITIQGVIETVEETINKLQENPQPDLILMDIQLDDYVPNPQRVPERKRNGILQIE